MISEADRDHEAALEFDQARSRVMALLAGATRDESGEPILYMITKNRKSATFAVHVIIVRASDGTPVTITAEISTITGLRYTGTHRGVSVHTMGTNVHLALTAQVARKLGLTLTYRSL